MRREESPGQFERSYFDSVYRDYAAQNPMQKLRYYRTLIERSLPEKQDLRLLDVGCAFGRFLSSLPPHWQRFGADVSHYAIAHASAAVPDITFATYDGVHLPFEGQFDAITALDVLEHVPQLNELLRNIATALRPGGVLLYVVPVYDGPTGPVIRLLDRDETHIHKWDRWSWLSLVSNSLTIERWEGIYRYLLPGRSYLHLPTKSLRRFTPAIAVIARKPAT